ncbi:MAG: GNAT family N-acetyltransferase [Alphaproteobacteria bacterium]|nr:MAG: GNAT family N-acetyltransferase [Alphaproteobacteria bacterium]
MHEPALQPVTSDNVEAACALRLLPHQDAHVESVAESLALAYTLPTKAWPRLVYDRSALVAFVMAFHQVDWPGDPAGVTRSGLWRLNVDARHQHQGYGRFAVSAVCADLRERGERACFVTYDAGEDGPEGFYLQLGFRPTGESSGHEVVARLDL